MSIIFANVNLQRKIKHDGFKIITKMHVIEHAEDCQLLATFLILATQLTTTVIICIVHDPPLSLPFAPRWRPRLLRRLVT